MAKNESWCDGVKGHRCSFQLYDFARTPLASALMYSWGKRPRRMAKAPWRRTQSASVPIILKCHFRMEPGRLSRSCWRCRQRWGSSSRSQLASCLCSPDWERSCWIVGELGSWRKVTSVKMIVIPKSTRLKARAKKSLECGDKYVKGFK